jgi:hypothetical protein
MSKPMVGELGMAILLLSAQTKTENGEAQFMFSVEQVRNLYSGNLYIDVEKLDELSPEDGERRADEYTEPIITAKKRLQST